LLRTNPVPGDWVLGRWVERDTDVPDLGYHYAALDHAVSNVVVRGHLVLTNGTAVGLLGATAFDLQAGGRLTSEGSPATLNRLVAYSNVQEQPGTNWSSWALAQILGGGTNYTMDLRLTDVSLAPGRVAPVLYSGSQAFGRFSVRDSLVRGGELRLYP
jgi:hypothetical protein